MIDQHRITRDFVLTDPGVHNLTKEVLELSEGRDIVDRVHDVKLALIVLENEMNLALYGSADIKR